MNKKTPTLLRTISSGLTEKTVFFSLLFLFTAFSTQSYGSAEQLHVSIEKITTTDDSSQQGSLLRFTFRNVSNEDFYIINYETPLQGIERNLLRISHNDEQVPYIGKLVRRPGPSKKDWQRIKSGEAISADINISESYAIPENGYYNVEYQALQHIVPASLFSDQYIFNSKKKHTGNRNLQKGRFNIPAKPVIVSSVSDWLELHSSENLRKGFSDKKSQRNNSKTIARAPDNNFIGCTNGEKSQLYEALWEGYDQATLSYYYLNNYGYSYFYDTWFGYPLFFSTVTNTFNRTRSALNGDVTFDCTCNSNAYAYTFPNTYKKIWICDYFWGSGWQEQANTMVHEATHWNTVLGTEDWTYGFNACKALAAAPLGYLRAFDNADNYAYASQEVPYPW